MKQEPRLAEHVPEGRPTAGKMKPEIWIVTAFIAGVAITAALVMFTTESPSSIMIRGLLTPHAAPVGAQQPVDDNAANSLSPAPGARVLENNHYVTYIYYTGKTFTPSTVVIKSGEEVRFINTVNTTMRVGSRAENLSSAQYSSYSEAYPAPEGGKYELVLSQPGIWSYENLTSQPRVFGVVYVQ